MPTPPGGCSSNTNSEPAWFRPHTVNLHVRTCLNRVAHHKHARFRLVGVSWDRGQSQPVTATARSKSLQKRTSGTSFLAPLRSDDHVPTHADCLIGQPGLPATACFGSGPNVPHNSGHRSQETQPRRMHSYQPILRRSRSRTVNSRRTLRKRPRNRASDKTAGHAGEDHPERYHPV